jgi:histidinol dehydrogenase
MNEIIHEETNDLAIEELRERIIASVRKGSQSALLEAANFFESWESSKVRNEKSDLEKESLIDDILLSIQHANKRIDENQKVIDISKAETRIMLDYLKEITKNVG